MKQLFLHDPVRLVLDALPALVADHILLVGEVGLIDLIEQITHSIGFEPQRELEAIGRHGLEVVGPIEVGGPVQIAAAGALQQPEVRVARDVLRALKHHVLEQVGEAGSPRIFVRGTDVVPQVDRDERQPVIFGQDHFEAVRQRVFLELDRWNVGLGGLRGWLAGLRVPVAGRRAENGRAENDCAENGGEHRLHALHDLSSEWL